VHSLSHQEHSAASTNDPLANSTADTSPATCLELESSEFVLGEFDVFAGFVFMVY
jgi:hypothetical protein